MKKEYLCTEYTSTGAYSVSIFAASFGEAGLIAEEKGLQLDGELKFRLEGITDEEADRIIAIMAEKELHSLH